MKPSVYVNENNWMSSNRKVEATQTWRKEQNDIPDVGSAETIAESEVNWQKWKLQRNFKKILTNVTVDNVVGITNEIKSIVLDSQLSIKFPGVSEVNVILHHLVSRVLDGKEIVEIAVFVCRILNGMYCLHSMP